MTKGVLIFISFIGLVVLIYLFNLNNNVGKEEKLSLPSIAKSLDKSKDANTLTIKKENIKDSEKTERARTLNKIDKDLESILVLVKYGQLKQISRSNINRIITKMRKNGIDFSNEYNAIINLYKTQISSSSKIFLTSLLGEIATYESAVTLTKVLDLNIDNSNIIYENKRAIMNLIFHDITGDINLDISPALIEYWEGSTINTYKPTIASAIFQIGNLKETKRLIEYLQNDISQNNYIADAMKDIRDKDTTIYLYKKYNEKNTSQKLKQIIISTFPYIANKESILFLYDWASKTENIEKIEKYFNIIKRKNPKSEDIIKEELYSNREEFKSKEIKKTIENIFKISRVK